MHRKMACVNGINRWLFHGGPWEAGDCSRPPPMAHCVFVAFTVTPLYAWHGNAYRVTSPSHGDSAGYWWIPLKKASDTELVCLFLLWSIPTSFWATNGVVCNLKRINTNRTIYQILQCTCPISHNTPFRTEIDIFLFWMVHCGIWGRCIVGFVNLVYLMSL